jgi:Flp pilus assembly protein TadD
VATPNEAGGADPAAMRERARALLDLGRADEALESAQRALIADPSDPDTEMLVARCHAVLGQPEDCIRHANRAAQLAPESPIPHVLRARVLVSIGHRDEAERAADQAIALAPEAALTHSTKGVVLAAAERRPADAWASMVRAVQISPDDARIRVDAARVALSLRNWTEAEAQAQAALALDPDDSDAMNLLGAAFSKQGRSADALAHFAGAARSDPAGSGGELARETARRLAGTDGLDVRKIWLVLIASTGAVWTLALLPRSLTVPAFLLVVVAAVVAWSAWRRRRRDEYEALSDEQRAMVDRAAADPSPVLVMTLWTVFGVAAFVGGLYLLQIVAPPSDGATATSTQSAVVITIAAAVMAACWWRLRSFRPSPEE